MYSIHVYVLHCTLYFDPLTEWAMMCVTEELMSPRILAPMKWAWLHSWDSSTLSLNPVKQRTRPSMLQEYTGRLLRGRPCDGEREREERDGERGKERERERERKRERERERENMRLLQCLCGLSAYTYWYKPNTDNE